MENVKNIINETGISKVKIAKFLGVSRQMLYNYLELADVDDLPKDKQNRLFILFGISDKNGISEIKVDDEYIATLEAKISEDATDLGSKNAFYDIKGLNRKEQDLLAKIFALLKDIIIMDKKDREGDVTLRYLYHYLLTMMKNPELAYILGYVAKNNNFIDPLEFVYNEDEQYTFEGIIYSAFTLYNNGNAVPNKVSEVHKKWEKEIEIKKEEKLGRTQELISLRSQALKELGYASINDANAKEVFEKISEIMSRNA